MTAQCIYAPVGYRESIQEDKWVKESLNLSRASIYPHYKMGAVIIKKNKVVSYGINSRKTHPLQKKFNPKEINKAHALHAEMHAISLACVEDLIDSTIYVGRLTKTGLVANSRPCIACYTAMKTFGVKSFVYWESGNFYKEYFE